MPTAADSGLRRREDSGVLGVSHLSGDRIHAYVISSWSIARRKNSERALHGLSVARLMALNKRRRWGVKTLVKRRGRTGRPSMAREKSKSE